MNKKNQYVCPICGKPTFKYMGNYRKDGLCMGHAKRLKEGKIVLENGVYKDTETGLILNGEKNIAQDGKNILDYIKGVFNRNEVKDGSAFAKEAKKVYDYVENIVKYNAIESKEFEDEKAYEAYKYARPIQWTPTFFSHTFRYGDLDYRDVKVFYDYYKASVLVSELEKFARLTGEDTMDNSSAVLNDFYKMISKKEVNFSLCKHLTSNAAPVLEVLEDKLNELEELE